MELNRLVALLRINDFFKNKKITKSPPLPDPINLIQHSKSLPTPLNIPESNQSHLHIKFHFQHCLEINNNRSRILFNPSNIEYEIRLQDVPFSNRLPYNSQIQTNSS